MSSILKIFALFLIIVVIVETESEKVETKRPRVFRVRVDFKAEANSNNRDGRTLANVFPFVGGKKGSPRARFFPQDQQLRTNNRRNENSHHPIRIDLPPEPENLEVVDLPEFESFHRVDHVVEPLSIFTQPQVELPPEQQQPADTLDHPELHHLDFQVEQTSQRALQSNPDHSNFQHIPQGVVQPNPHPVSHGFEQKKFQFQKNPQRVLTSNLHHHSSDNSNDSNFQHVPPTAFAQTNPQPISQGFEVVTSDPTQVSQGFSVVTSDPRQISQGFEVQAHQAITQTNAQGFDQSEFKVQNINNLPDSRLPRQRTNQAPPSPSRSSNGAAEDGLDIGTIALAGERCVDKVIMVEETEYDDVVECKHSYNERCHTTYTTDFEPQQEEECEENFVKECFIEYKKVAEEEKIKFCHTPLVCEGEGPVECKTVYETECQTRFHEHQVDDDVVDCQTIQEEKCESVTQGYTTQQKCTKWPKQVCKQEKQRVAKYSPETECKKVPRELCGPSGCVLRPGPEECFDKKEVVVQEVPEESCNLEPERSCKHVTKLVPLLKAGEECVDIPKEVCSRSRTNPRKVQKPVVKKWCYIPTEQSGLA